MTKAVFTPQTQKICQDFELMVTMMTAQAQGQLADIATGITVASDGAVNNLAGGAGKPRER